MPSSESNNGDHRIDLVCEAGDVTIEAATPATNDEGEQDEASGGLPRFSMVAYTGGPMQVTGWRHPVVVDFEGLQITAQRRPIRFAHSAYQGVGHTERIAVEDGKLIAEGLVSRDTPAAREVVSSGKRGFPWQASIGAGVQEAELIRAGRSVTVNGRTFEGPIYVARKTVLGEISFVDIGADINSSAQIAAQQETKVMDDNSSGNDQQAQESQQTAVPQQSTNPSASDPPESPETPVATGGVQASGDNNPGSAGNTSTGSTVVTHQVDQQLEAARKQAADELRRQSKIREIASEYPEIAAKAIEEGWSAEKAELEVLRASRPKVHSGGGGGGDGTGPPSVQSGQSQGVVNAEVLEAACMLSGGMNQPEKIFAEQTLDVADRRFRGGIGLQELLLEAAWANGYSGRNFRASRDVLRFAFAPGGPGSGGLPGIQASSFSSIDVGGILSNVANKFLLEGFFSVERTWRNVCSVRNVSDFKTVTSYRLIGKDQYEKVAPGGELKHGTLGEEQYANQADTYGLRLSVDRRDIINDDLGAITTVPRKLGRGSGLKINDVFWTEFLNNADFFKTANNNFLEGADTKLSIDGLTKAEQAFMDQVDADGKPIGIMPAIMLVPTALNAIGTTLQQSLEIRDPGSTSKYPVANPHTGKFRTVVSRYLANNYYTGASDKAWYLLAEPNDLSVIEVAFLNGQESPTIETAEADFNVLGIQMRGYHDFGVAKQDPRAGIKSKGEA